MRGRLKYLAVVAAILFGGMAYGQSCTPSGGVTCSANLNLWILPANYLNWNTPTNTNWQTIDTWSATVLPLSGGTMTGNLILNADPTSNLQAATKHYVDSQLGGGSFTLGSTLITLGSTTTAVTGLTIDSVSPTTMSYLDATSSIQTQLNAKAASGANSDITSILGLTTPLSVAQGGTGAATLTGYVSGNGTGAFTASTTIPVASVTGAAPLASPAFTGTPTAPTATPLTNSTQIGTTAYADAAVAVEKTRAETAEALLAPLASPALTGTPVAPTASPNTNTTQIATTAYVGGEITINTYCGTTTTCANTSVANPIKHAWGGATLAAGVATITGISPAFTSTTNAQCGCQDTTTGTDACSAVLASASSVTLTGNATDTVQYSCWGP